MRQLHGCHRDYRALVWIRQGGCKTLTYKVSNECAMKIGDFLHAARDVAWSWCTTGVTVGLFLIVVIAQHEAQQEAWHHNITYSQHGEVAACGTEKQGPIFTGSTILDAAQALAALSSPQHWHSHLLNCQG